MLREGFAIYRATRKKHDQVFNTYVMRPIAGVFVALASRTSVTPNQLTLVNLALFVIAMVLLVTLRSYQGGLLAVLVLELSYMLDCADGMLARHKKLASQAGHLFDFFTDELKAILLVVALGLRAAYAGGLSPTLTLLERETWLVATSLGAVVVGSATSLTNFVRRPELTGKDTPISAHYENVDTTIPSSWLGRIGWGMVTLLRFLNHYPSHIYLFAAFSKLDLFFWIYAGNNALYLGRGWLGLVLRFGRT